MQSYIYRIEFTSNLGTLFTICKDFDEAYQWAKKHIEIELSYHTGQMFTPIIQINSISQLYPMSV